MHFQDSTYEPAHLFHCYFFRCCRFPPLAANSRENDVAAVVNGVEITQSEASFLLSHYYSKLRFNMRRSFVCLCKCSIDDSSCDDTIKVQ